MKRRSFIRKASTAGMVLGAGSWPWEVLAREGAVQKLTVLHTNDWHSRMEPFPMDGSRNQGLGGAARRSTLIQKIRETEEQVLLLDAGDMFQGTPYFNFFGGELEFKLMSKMGYDAATIGNHDFDAGIEGLHKQLPLAQFPLIISNYDFSDTIMNGQTTPYQIFQKGDLKIGVLGIGIKLRGLVPAKAYLATRYLDPIEMADRYAARLKGDYACDYVICLSHLGFKYDENERVSDHDLARQTQNIDLILGGHTHTFLDRPIELENAVGRKVLVTQAGWAGLVLGRLDIYFEKRRKRQKVTSGPILVGQN